MNLLADKALDKILSQRNSIAFFTLYILSLCCFANAAKANQSDTQHNELVERILSEQVRIHKPHVEEGEIFSQVFQMLEDDAGYMWISSVNALSRYNGYIVEPYGEEHGIEDGVVGTPFLFKGRDGTIWVSDGRLHRYDAPQNRFDTFFVTSDGSGSSMVEDFEGNLWVSGESFGVRKFDTQLNRVVDELEPPKGIVWKVQNIAAEPSWNRLWFTSDVGLFRYDLNTQELTKVSTPVDDKLKSATKQKLACGNEEYCWLGGQFGLVRINIDTFETKLYQNNVNDPQSLRHNIVMSVEVDSENNLWVGYDKKGISLYMRDEDKFVHIKETPSNAELMPPSAIFDILRDKRGSLWLSTNTYGVRRISPQFDTVRQLRNEIGNPNSLAFNHVLTIFEETPERIWIATDGGGVNLYNPKSETFSKLIDRDPLDPNSLSSNSAIGLDVDINGDLWVGTWGGGLNKVDTEDFSVTRFTNDESLPENKTIGTDNIFKIFSDIEKGFWYSAWNFGVEYYNLETGLITRYHVDNSEEKAPGSITSQNIIDMKYDKDGRLWLAGSSGIEIFDKENQSFERFIGGPEFYLKSILLTDEKIYAANISGLEEIDRATKKRVRYTMDDGLSDNNVQSLSMDSNGNIWMGTVNGVTVFDPEEMEFQRYYEEDGFIDNNFDIYANMFSSDGKIYIGGKGGLNIVDPNQVPRNKEAPTTYISKITVINKDFIKTEITSPTSLNSKDKKSLNYDENSFIFNFYAVNLIFPNKNKYKYRLLGHDSEFSYSTSSKRFAEYTNLPPGDYIFEVFGSNNNDVWDSFGDKYAFSVLKPWWTTWWAIALFAIAAAFSIWLLFAWRLAQNKAKQKELAQLVYSKTSELNDLNRDLESRVANRTKELSVEVEERKLAEAKLFHMAFHDALTGLPNRPWLSKKLDDLLIEIKDEDDRKFGMMFLDGDKFKQINDTYGHLIGDKLLKASSARLTRLLKSNEHAIRLGGDEFTVLLESVTSITQIEDLAQKIIVDFKKPFNLDGNTIYFNVSIGILLCDNQYTNTSSVLRDADIAMYVAKKENKGYYKVFDQKMRDQSKEIAELEKDLKKAIKNGEFFLEYQPITSMNKSIPLKVEVLLRWKHPRKGLVHPDKFLPVAEESGLMTEIGRWVMTQVFALNQKHGLANIQFCINVSSGEIKHPTLLDFLSESFEKYDTDPQNIIFEATEETFMENSSSVKKSLVALKNLGIKLSIDDFGKGYTSLSYLKELPVQLVKIDRAFVRSITKKEQRVDGQKIVNATVILAHSLKMEIIAQGVENQTQLELLQVIECDYMQGFYIAKPMDFEGLCEFVEKY